MSFLRTTWIVFIRDLRMERRTGEIVSATSVFALLVAVLCAFAFDFSSATGAGAAPGVLWIALTFSAVLATARSWLREREMDAWIGVLCSPASRAGLYAGKAMGLGVFLLLVCALLVPIVALLFHAPFFEQLHRVVPVILAGVIGVSAAGALFGAMIVRTAVRDLLLGCVLLPLLSPLLILGAEGTAAALSAGGAAIGGYLRLMVALDIIYLALGLWLFEPLMED